jgi:hypothetical protein
MVVQRSRVFPTRIDAERFINSSEVSKARGEWVDPALGRIPLSEWGSEWLQGVGPALKGGAAWLSWLWSPSQLCTPRQHPRVTSTIYAANLRRSMSRRESRAFPPARSASGTD